MIAKHYLVEAAHDDQYQFFFQKQKGRCAICGCRDEQRKLSLDHNHETGVSRGLLCGPCNRGIGLLRDCPEVCMAASTYLSQTFAGNPIYPE